MKNRLTAQEQKKKLRSLYLKKRDQMEPLVRREASEKITERLLKFKRFRTAKTVFVYASCKSEVETGALIKAALRLGKKVAVPKVNGTEMDFYEITSYEDLYPGYQGILEPQPGEQEPVLPVDSDVILFPGIVFDHKGARIGYGGGFYDRYLCRIQEQTGAQPGLIGLAFRSQVYPGKLPLEETDKKIDCIITERSVIIPRED